MPCAFSQQDLLQRDGKKTVVKTLYSAVAVCSINQHQSLDFRDKRSLGNLTVVKLHSEKPCRSAASQIKLDPFCRYRGDNHASGTVNGLSGNPENVTLPRLRMAKIHRYTHKLFVIKVRRHDSKYTPERAGMLSKLLYFKVTCQSRTALWDLCLHGRSPAWAASAHWDRHWGIRASRAHGVRKCVPLTACLVWYLVPWEDCACCDWDCWLCCCCCCLCTFCMCHFWEDVWNLLEEFHTTRCTAGAVSLGSRGLCFFMGLPVAADGALTVEEALVVAVTPAGGVWAAERVSTGVSGRGWVLAQEEGGVLPTTKQTQLVMPAFHQCICSIIFHLIRHRHLPVYFELFSSKDNWNSTTKLISV